VQLFLRDAARVGRALISGYFNYNLLDNDDLEHLDNDDLEHAELYDPATGTVSRPGMLIRSLNAVSLRRASSVTETF